MPKGPQGQKRPADAVARAVMVGKIATGEIEETGYAAPGRKVSGKAGAAARNAKLSPERRREIATSATGARWNEGRLEVTEQARLMRTLFEHPGRTHIDVKFFRGTSSDVSPEDVCREANSVIFQIDSGMVEGDEAFEEIFKQVEIAELLKAL
jgi:hypothetical protein